MPYVFPFVIGAFLAFLLEPLVVFLVERTRMTRAWAAFLCILVLVTGLGLFVSWAVTRVAQEVADLYGYLPQYYGEYNKILEDVLRMWVSSPRLPEPLARIAQDQWNLVCICRHCLSAGGFVKGLPGFSVSMFFTIISSYFLTRTECHQRASRAASGKTFASKRLEAIRRDCGIDKGPKCCW